MELTFKWELLIVSSYCLLESRAWHVGLYCYMCNMPPLASYREEEEYVHIRSNIFSGIKIIAADSLLLATKIIYILQPGTTGVNRIHSIITIMHGASHTCNLT
jgi:hypothetical protein